MIFVFFRFKVIDDSQKYEYNIGICTNAVAGKGLGPNIGVVQNRIKPEDKPAANHWIIGYYNQSQLIDGTDWLILEYNGGEPYHTNCGNEKRRARIMITCDENVKPGDEQNSMKVIEEERDKFQDCYYLFEMGTSIMCEKKQLITVSLSVGSILVIVFIVVVILYGLLGFLYQRLVLGAKGKEQIPNYSFWQDFGNLQADGCNLVCRTGDRFESKQYKGVGDDQLQEEDDRDDHLLPM